MKNILSQFSKPISTISINFIYSLVSSFSGQANRHHQVNHLMVSLHYQHFVLLYCLHLYLIERRHHHRFQAASAPLGHHLAPNQPYRLYQRYLLDLNYRFAYQIYLNYLFDQTQLSLLHYQLKRFHLLYRLDLPCVHLILHLH